MAYQLLEVHQGHASYNLVHHIAATHIVVMHIAYRDWFPSFAGYLLSSDASSCFFFWDRHLQFWTRRASLFDLCHQYPFSHTTEQQEIYQESQSPGPPTATPVTPASPKVHFKVWIMPFWTASEKWPQKSIEMSKTTILGTSFTALFGDFHMDYSGPLFQVKKSGCVIKCRLCVTRCTFWEIVGLVFGPIPVGGCLGYLPPQLMTSQGCRRATSQADALIALAISYMSVHQHSCDMSVTLKTQSDVKGSQIQRANVPTAHQLTYAVIFPLIAPWNLRVNDVTDTWLFLDSRQTGRHFRQTTDDRQPYWVRIVDSRAPTEAQVKTAWQHRQHGDGEDRDRPWHWDPQLTAWGKTFHASLIDISSAIPISAKFWYPLLRPGSQTGYLPPCLGDWCSGLYHCWFGFIKLVTFFL